MSCNKPERLCASHTHGLQDRRMNVCAFDESADLKGANDLDWIVAAGAGYI